MKDGKDKESTGLLPLHIPEPTWLANPTHWTKCLGKRFFDMKAKGKKYSNISYGHSMQQGLNEITNAPNLKFIIHNSGGKKHNNDFNYSTFMDNSKKSPFTRSTAIRHNIDFENLRCEYKYIYNINKVKWN